MSPVRMIARFDSRKMRVLALCAALITPCALLRAADTAPEEFPSADSAAKALVSAFRTGNPASILKVLGPEAKDLIISGDPVQDKNARERFVAAYDEQHELLPHGDNEKELVIGRDNWPSPIPIVQSGGHWHFDSAAGADELVNRRIGKNELLTIRTLLASVEAERDYFSRLKAGTGTGAYAQKFMSTPGETDGLYWPAADGEAPSPLGPLVDEAIDEGYPGAAAPDGKPTAYHGYYFRVLKAQGPDAPGGARDYVNNGAMTGGFAFLAWPAQYESSGVVTFEVNQDGVVFQKDLGPDTAKLAGAITQFNPGLSWARVDVKD